MLGNEGVIDKIEKCRRGNGLDGKRRGPAVSTLSNRLQAHLPSAATVIQLLWDCDVGAGLKPEVCA